MITPNGFMLKLIITIFLLIMRCDDALYYFSNVLENEKFAMLTLAKKVYNFYDYLCISA